MDIKAYLEAEKQQIGQEFNEYITRIESLETQLAGLRVSAEHLRGAYQRIEAMQERLEVADTEQVPARLYEVDSREPKTEA